MSSAYFPLNALKTVADGCGQLAEQIRRTYGDLRGRLSVVDLQSTYRSITPLWKICGSIVSEVRRLPGEWAELIEAVETGYGLVQDARDAADRHFDNRVARANYLAAARKFEEAIGRAHGILDIHLHDHKTIGWYLKIEWANALISSLPGKVTEADESQEHDYRRACVLYGQLETTLPGDPVMLLRRAQAQRKAIRSEGDAVGVVRQLTTCLRRIEDGAEARPGEAALTSQLARIELGLARLAYSDSAKSRDPREAEAELREAIRDVQGIAPDDLPLQADRETLRVYHRAMSNVLWFFHRLRLIEGTRLQEEDLAIIRSNIKRLRNEDVFWRTVRFYTETIENLMYGYEIIGEIPKANEMAELNLTLLRELANDQRKPGDNRDMIEFLNAEEKDMYLEALHFQHTQMKLSPPSGDRAVESARSG
jgi:hypothetical protein